jgi:hypothetical protein
MTGLESQRLRMSIWVHGIFLGLIISAAVLWAVAYQNVAIADPFSELVIFSDNQEGCTIGVASGLVTEDGRPILWKVRDVTEEGRQQLVHVAGLPYSYIGVCTEGEVIYMGLNEAGVASGNSLVKLTSATAPNSSVQSHILRSYASVNQIEDYFLSARQAGTCQASGCFPFIDAYGDSRIFEVNRSSQIWEYDSLNPARQIQGLYGFVVRANEFHMRSDETDNTSIDGRYQSGVHNVLGLIANGALSVRALLQGHGESREYYEFIRYGPGRELATIARDTTRSAVIVHGVLPDEDSALATMWVILGQTNYSIAVPTWARVSDVPHCLNSGLMYDRARSLWLKGAEGITQASVFPLESHLIDVVTETLLPHWRVYGIPDASEITRIENQMASDAYSLLDCLDRQQSDHQVPMISLRASPYSLTLSFTVAADDSDGSPVATYWDFGDNCYSDEPSSLHTYGQPGMYLISCTVTDNCGVSVTDWRYYGVPVNVDLTGDDGLVTMRDLAQLASVWRQSGCGEPNWCGGIDFDRSGSVDFLDLKVLSRHWLLANKDIVK